MSPGTMVAETESGYNRRKAIRGEARIYRPPAARHNIMTASEENRPPLPNEQQERWNEQQQQYLQALKDYQQNQISQNSQPSTNSNLNKSPLHTSQVLSNRFNENSTKQRSKRPDQQLYVPRRRRHDDTSYSNCLSSMPDGDDNPRPPSPTNSICSIVSEFSGRNRYNKKNPKPHIFTDEKICTKPPRASRKSEDKQHNKSIFSRDTLQLIERCINHDSDNKPCNSPLTYDAYPYNTNYIVDESYDYSKENNPSKNLHPVHSKENLLHPAESTPKSRKGKKNRKRPQKSRDPSLESRENRSRRGSLCSVDLQNSPYSQKYPTNIYESGYDRAQSCTASRAPSIEQLSSCDFEDNWRVQCRSLPSSPIKPQSQHNEQRRHSTGRKSPLSKLNSLPLTVENNTLDRNSCTEPLTKSITTSENSSLDSPHENYFTSSSADIPNSDEMCSLSPEKSHLSQELNSVLNASNVDEEPGSTSSHNLSFDQKCVHNEDGPSLLPVSPPRLPEVYHNEEVCGGPLQESLIGNTSQNIPLPNCGNDETASDDSQDTSCSNDPFNPKKFSFNWADEVEHAAEDSWDSIYDDSGNCLEPSLLRQLDDKIGKLKLEAPSGDYSDFKPQEPQVNDQEYGHVIEIYDFPSSFKNQDLMTVFQSYQDIDVKWVDDTHALGIFATAHVANQVLMSSHPFVKTRPLSLATHASKAKALRITEMLLPYKQRPQTSAALARRLVSGALGLKVNISREVREAERQRLKNAKEKRRMIAKQKEDAWEGTLANLA